MVEDFLTMLKMRNGKVVENILPEEISHNLRIFNHFHEIGKKQP